MAARTFNAPIIANDNSLDRLTDVQIPLALFFWRDQNALNDINAALIDLAKQEAGELIIARIDVAENPEGQRRFAVNQTPLLIGLRLGEELTRVAPRNAAEVKAHIDYLLARGPKPSAKVVKSEVHTAEGRPVHITDSIFEQAVLRSELPVLVDFWAPWCGPCHSVAPTLDSLARDYAGRMKVAKVNVDQNPHYAGVYGVQGIPTLLFVRNGQVVDRLVGAQPAPILRGRIETLLRTH